MTNMPPTPSRTDAPEGSAEHRAAAGAAAADANISEEQPPIEPGTPLPMVRFECAPEEVIRRLDATARRGRLPGFMSPGPSGSLFSVAAFGSPWDGVVEARLRERVGAGCLIEPRCRLKRLGPAIFGVVLALSIWPGVLLTESLIASYFPAGWSKWTWYWYLPLTIPTMPWALWWSIRTSRAQVHASAYRAVLAIARHGGGRLEPTPRSPSTPQSRS
jgi:hypothetical protein